MNDMRCTLCYTEHSSEKIKNTSKCPVCKTTLPPHKVEEDVVLIINWQELRALTIPAYRWYKMHAKSFDPDMFRAIEAILGRLYESRPEGAGTLTVEDELDELTEEGKNIEAYKGLETKKSKLSN